MIIRPFYKESILEKTYSHKTSFILAISTRTEPLHLHCNNFASMKNIYNLQGVYNYIIIYNLFTVTLQCKNESWWLVGVPTSRWNETTGGPKCLNERSSGSWHAEEIFFPLQEIYDYWLFVVTTTRMAANWEDETNFRFSSKKNNNNGPERSLSRNDNRNEKFAQEVPDDTNLDFVTNTLWHKQTYSRRSRRNCIFLLPFGESRLVLAKITLGSAQHRYKASNFIIFFFQWRLYC